MADVAWNVLTKRKKSVEFSKLWGDVVEALGYDATQQQRKIAQFYTELMLDKRFISLDDNKWDLSARHTYNERVVEILDIDDEDDEDFDIDSEDEEGKKETAEDEF